MNNEGIDDALIPYGSGTDVERVPGLPYSLTLTAAATDSKSAATQEHMDVSFPPPPLFVARESRSGGHLGRNASCPLVVVLLPA